MLKPILIPYIELFPQLLRNHLIAPVHLPPFRPSFRNRYDVDAHYDYRVVNPKHPIKNYTMVKYKLQELIDVGALTFKNREQSNVVRNPLPNHTGVW